MRLWMRLLKAVSDAADTLKEPGKSLSLSCGRTDNRYAKQPFQSAQINRYLAFARLIKQIHAHDHLRRQFHHLQRKHQVARKTCAITDHNHTVRLRRLQKRHCHALFF